jgi:hypothetical protein
MGTEQLRAVMVRDLRAAAREVEAYGSDAALWRAVPGVSNSGGMLALHLAGNLRHFIGAVLGGTGYVRDREAEFARRGAGVPGVGVPGAGSSSAVSPNAVSPGNGPVDASGPAAVLPVLSREQVAAELRLAAKEVELTLRALPSVRLDAEYPVPVVGRRLRTSQFLMHLVSHLGYHLGQLDYHRRLGDPASTGPVGAMSLEELPGEE